MLGLMISVHFGVIFVVTEELMWKHKEDSFLWKISGKTVNWVDGRNPSLSPMMALKMTEMLQKRKGENLGISEMNQVWNPQ